MVWQNKARTVQWLMYGRRTILVKKGVNVLNWLDKLERKFGRYAIPNLTVYLLAGYVIGFAVYYLAPNLLRYLTLEPYYILHGQIWRIISWVLIPPTGSLFSLFFLVLLYYSLGTALERTWGHSGIMSIFFPVFSLLWSLYLFYTEYFILFMELHFRCPASDWSHELYYDVDLPGIRFNLSWYGSDALLYSAD